MGVSFAHVHLTTTDLETHASLWSELLSGTALEREGITAIDVPGALIFFQEQEPTAPSVSTTVDHFGSKVRDIQAVLAKWWEMGHQVDDEWVSSEGTTKAYLTMPEGVRLELEGDPDLSTEAAMHHVHFYAPRHRELLSWYADLFHAEPRVRGSIETTADVPGANLSFSNSDRARGRRLARLSITSDSKWRI